MPGARRRTRRRTCSTRRRRSGCASTSAVSVGVGAAVAIDGSGARELERCAANAPNATVVHVHVHLPSHGRHCRCVESRDSSRIRMPTFRLSFVTCVRERGKLRMAQTTTPVLQYLTSMLGHAVGDLGVEPAPREDCTLPGRTVNPLLLPLRHVEHLGAHLLMSTAATSCARRRASRRLPRGTY